MKTHRVNSIPLNICSTNFDEAGAGVGNVNDAQPVDAGRGSFYRLLLRPSVSYTITTRKIELTVSSFANARFIRTSGFPTKSMFVV